MLSHIGFIMDGNRRFGELNGLSKKESYRAGMLKFFDFLKYQVKYDVKKTSFYALSDDNYVKRPDNEKNALFELMESFVDDEDMFNFLIENNFQVNLIGDIDVFRQKDEGSKERVLIDKLESKFASLLEADKEVKYVVNIALNYGGQAEILHSFKEIYRKVESGKISFDEIDVKTIKENLWFKDEPAQVIVRPGDAPRLSGFMLYDSAYSEIYLTKKLWPQLEEKDFSDIIDWYNGIKRNFGK